MTGVETWDGLRCQRKQIFQLASYIPILDLVWGAVIMFVASLENNLTAKALCSEAKLDVEDDPASGGVPLSKA